MKKNAFRLQIKIFCLTLKRKYLKRDIEVIKQ